MRTIDVDSLPAVLTLAEAVMLAAYGLRIGRERLRQWMAHRGGSFPRPVQQRLDAAGRRVVQLIYQGQVIAFGEPFRFYSSGTEHLGERTMIRDKAFLGLAFADAKTDCLIPDMAPGDETRLEAACAIDVQYKHVTVDCREFLAAIQRSRGSPRLATEDSPYWNLAQALAWVSSRNTVVVAKYRGYDGCNIDSSLRHLDLTLTWNLHSDGRTPALPASHGRTEALLNALQRGEIGARGRRAPNFRPERISTEEWAHLGLNTFRNDEGTACDGAGPWIELRFLASELQRAFPVLQPERGDTAPVRLIEDSQRHPTRDADVSAAREYFKALGKTAAEWCPLAVQAWIATRNPEIVQQLNVQDDQVQIALLMQKAGGVDVGATNIP